VRNAGGEAEGEGEGESRCWRELACCRGAAQNEGAAPPCNPPVASLRPLVEKEPVVAVRVPPPVRDSAAMMSRSGPYTLPSPSPSLPLPLPTPPPPKTSAVSAWAASAPVPGLRLRWPLPASARSSPNGAPAFTPPSS
jgi:hypothetical protein